MDPILSAVISALQIAGNTALDEALRKATGDAYDRLKELLKRKFGGNHPATTLISEIEAELDNEKVRSEKGAMIAALNLGRDPEILDAARSVSDSTSMISKSIIQSRFTHFHGTVYGPTGDGATVTYNFGSVPDQKKA